MSVNTDIFHHTIIEALQNEHNFISGINEAGLFSIPKNILQYICGKAIYQMRSQVFDTTEAQWLWKPNKTNTAEALTFSYKLHGQQHLLFFDIIPVNQDEDLLLQMQNMLQNMQPHKKLVSILLKCTEKQAQVWVEKWEEKIGSIFKVATTPGAIATNAPDEKEKIWLITWKDTEPKETADVHANADIALTDAIRDMYFESMMQMLKRIISLRTNLDENTLQAQTQIAQIFKMVFAKEQGVPLDEVYDPEAMAGLTDSQLAAGNFISDMQKAFNIDFSDDEIMHINTLTDLVGAIIYKKVS